MPKTKAIGLYADRKEAVRRVINIGLARKAALPERPARCRMGTLF